MHADDLVQLQVVDNVGHRGLFMCLRVIVQSLRNAGETISGKRIWKEEHPGVWLLALERGHRQADEIGAVLRDQTPLALGRHRKLFRVRQAPVGDLQGAHHIQAKPARDHCYAR